MSSESRVLVMRVETAEAHNNADTLDLVTVGGGYPVITRRGEYQVGDLAAYVPVDMMLPTGDPRFAFLAARSVNAEGYHRVKAAKLRGIFSMGILFPAEDAAEGDDLTEAFGAVKWEPTMPAGSSGENEPCPFDFPCYTDVESYRKMRGCFRPGEEVIVTEKIHGANMRVLWKNDRLWVGSRTNVKRESDTDQWWIAARASHLERLALFPETILFGECYGPVQDMKYGRTSPTFVLFDALDLHTRRWLSHDRVMDIAAALDLRTAPVLYRGPLPENEAELWALAEGTTVLGDGVHVREGGVVKPAFERVDLRHGRVIGKLVGQGYHLRKGA